MNTIRIIPALTMTTLRTKVHKLFGGERDMMLLGDSEDGQAFEILTSRMLTDQEKAALTAASNVVKSFTQSASYPRKDEHNNG